MSLGGLDAAVLDKIARIMSYMTVQGACGQPCAGTARCSRLPCRHVLHVCHGCRCVWWCFTLACLPSRWRQEEAEEEGKGGIASGAPLKQPVPLAKPLLGGGGALIPLLACVSLLPRCCSNMGSRCRVP